VGDDGAEVAGSGVIAGRGQCQGSGVRGQGSGRPEEAAPGPFA
jgi:hypothetical protein